MWLANVGYNNNNNKWGRTGYNLKSTRIKSKFEMNDHANKNQVK